MITNWVPVPEVFAITNAYFPVCVSTGEISSVNFYLSIGLHVFVFGVVILIAGYLLSGALNDKSDN